MANVARLCMMLWLFGHVAGARADTSFGGGLPFAPRVLAASGTWLAAAAVVHDDDGDRVVVARSTDGGRSWRELPSPHWVGSKECCSENAGYGIVGVELSLGTGGLVDVDGRDSDCFNRLHWRY